MNRKYMHWLIRSRKVMIVFIALVYMILIFVPFISEHHTGGLRYGNYAAQSIVIGAVISVFLAILISYLLFAYIHRKKSVDLYFSLPVSRRQQLITGCLFAWIVPSVLFIIGSFLVWVTHMHSSAFGLMELLGLQVWVLYGLAAVVLCTTWVNAVANNVLDAFVMLCAYSALPVFISITLSTFSQMIIAGSPPVAAVNPYWLSPVYMTISNADMIAARNGNFNISYIPACAVLTAIACFGLKKEFVLRKSERAEQISDGFFAYPFIINVYAVIMMLIFAMSSVKSGFFQNGMVIWYLILLAVYIIASFVYRRSFRISWKMLLVFIIEMVCCLVIIRIGWKTRGFGLADRYSFNQKNGIGYNYTCEVKRDNLGENADSPDQYEEEWVQVDMSVDINPNQMKQYADAVDILETYRKEQIDDYYNKKDSECSGSLSIEDAYGTNNVWIYTYSYTLYKPLSEDQLKKLNTYPIVSIQVMDPYDEDSSYIPLSEYLKIRDS